MNRKWETYHGEELIDSGFHEVSWESLRQRRDAALKDSDWRALKDVVLTNPWKVYRTFLRDLPQSSSSSNDAADAWAAYDIPE